MLINAVAFCFYNISSIVNGLVYFDQFSVMTTQQLLLVLLGVIFLLGGVLSVSFHGGGGVADVATWQDDEETPENLSNSRYGLGVGENISRPSDLMQGSSSIPTSASPLRLSRSEPLEHVSDQSTAQQQHILSRQHTQTLRRHRRSFLQSSESHIPGGGFSIGLSPMSPGFTLIPKRRISTFSHVVGKLALRRAVSEGNVRYGNELDTNITSTEERNVGKRKIARDGWKWLRNVFNEGHIES